MSKVEAQQTILAGLFGGTFNPIHKGHLMVIERALNRFSLDRLYVIPCRVPPHKCAAYLAPAAQRLRMIQLALPADDRYRASDVEIQRSGPSYTIDTVNHFKTRFIPAAALFLIMGMDAFLELHTWKHYPRLLEIVQPVVLSRKVADPLPSSGDVSRMDAYIRAHLPGTYRYDDGQTCWQRSGGSCIHLLPTTPLDISSSQVRQRIRAGKTIADLVPRAVNGYIEKKELYR
jgi:nicotinate-nucleotide adenylyltransferase